MTKAERILEQWLLWEFISKDKYCSSCGNESSNHRLSSGFQCPALDSVRRVFFKDRDRANNNPYECPESFEYVHLTTYKYNPWYGYTDCGQLRGSRRSIMFKHGLSSTYQYGNYLFSYIRSRYKGKRYLPEDTEEKVNRKLGDSLGFGNHHRPYMGRQIEFATFADGDFCRIDLKTVLPVDSTECKCCGDLLVTYVPGGVELQDMWSGMSEPIDEFCAKDACQKVRLWLRYPGGLDTVGEIKPKRPLKLLETSGESLKRAIILSGYVDYKARAIENEKRN